MMFCVHVWWLFHVFSISLCATNLANSIHVRKVQQPKVYGATPQGRIARESTLQKELSAVSYDTMYTWIIGHVTSISFQSDPS